MRAAARRCEAAVRRFRWLTKLRLLRLYGGSFREQPLVALRYVLWDPELNNFTYDIANRDELIDTVVAATGLAHENVAGYVDEAETNPALYRGLPFRPLSHKLRPRYGRRLGWYALVRALAPELVVETGTHDGLGSIALLAALERNAADGRPGELLSVDTNPSAGWLVPNGLRTRWSLIVGSSFDVLPEALAGRSVGMIIHDSDHRYECEHFELMAAVEHAAPTLVLATDNAHATTALADIAKEQSVAFHVFREQPAGHFYPGAALGVSVLRRDAALTG